MKKSVLVLCAFLACAGVGTTVSAEETQTSTEAAAREGWQEYVSTASELYSLEMPEDFFEMNSENIETLISTLGEDIFANAGIDTSMLDQIDYTNSDYLYSKDMLSNINVQITKESQMTQTMFELMQTALDEQLKNQYMAIGVPEENCEPMGVEEIGENTFYRYAVEIQGQKMHQYMTCNENTDMFTITFTNVDEEIEKGIMESFKLL